jgi:osmotically-inducible protein OsmY
VALTGLVDDRQAKRAAERIAEAVYGVHTVHNQLRLRHYAFRH